MRMEADVFFRHLLLASLRNRVHFAKPVTSCVRHTSRPPEPESSDAECYCQRIVTAISPNEPGP